MIMSQCYAMDRPASWLLAQLLAGTTNLHRRAALDPSWWELVGIRQLRPESHWQPSDQGLPGRWPLRRARSISACG